MVSKRNILLIGVGVVLLGFTAFRLRPQRGGVVPPDPIQDPNREQITGLKQILATAQNIFTKTFPPPFKQVIRHPSQLRGPNLIGSFGAKGTRSAIDPFTGFRVAIGQTFRGTSRGAAAFGGVGQISSNLQRVQQGNILKSDLSNFITNITNQIGLLEKPNNVTL